MQLHRDKATTTVNNCSFLKYVSEDLIHRLSYLEQSFDTILDIGCRTGYLTSLLKQQYNQAQIVATDLSLTMLEYFDHPYKLQIDEENIDLLYDLIPKYNDSPQKPASDESNQNIARFEQGFDLIIFSFGMHWINDVPNFLIKIKDLLKPEGIFIANLAGGNSLKNLRSQIVEVEAKLNQIHSPHISPFIHFDHITPLFQQAGFKEIIVDYENIDLEYQNPYALMKMIKNIGESNSMAKSANYSISQKMLASLKNAPSPFYDKISLISFLASKNKKSIKLKR